MYNFLQENNQQAKSMVFISVNLLYFVFICEWCTFFLWYRFGILHDTYENDACQFAFFAFVVHDFNDLSLCRLSVLVVTCCVILNLIGVVIGQFFIIYIFKKIKHACSLRVVQMLVVAASLKNLRFYRFIRPYLEFQVVRIGKESQTTLQ